MNNDHYYYYSYYYYSVQYCTIIGSLQDVGEHRLLRVTARKRGYPPVS